MPFGPSDAPPLRGGGGHCNGGGGYSTHRAFSPTQGSLVAPMPPPQWGPVTAPQHFSALCPSHTPVAAPLPPSQRPPQCGACWGGGGVLGLRRAALPCPQVPKGQRAVPQCTSSPHPMPALLQFSQCPHKHHVAAACHPSPTVRTGHRSGGAGPLSCREVRGAPRRVPKTATQCVMQPNGPAGVCNYPNTQVAV